MNPHEMVNWVSENWIVLVKSAAFLGVGYALVSLAAYSFKSRGPQPGYVESPADRTRAGWAVVIGVVTGISYLLLESQK